MPVPYLLSMTPANQAARILAAWSSRNSAGLQVELRKTLDLDCPDHSWGLQEERLQLLQAVAGGIQEAPDPLVSGDRKVARCLDLLRHLVETENPRASSQPQRASSHFSAVLHQDR